MSSFPVPPQKTADSKDFGGEHDLRGTGPETITTIESSVDSSGALYKTTMRPLSGERPLIHNKPEITGSCEFSGEDGVASDVMPNKDSAQNCLPSSDASSTKPFAKERILTVAKTEIAECSTVTPTFGSLSTCHADNEGLRNVHHPQKLPLWSVDTSPFTRKLCETMENSGQKQTMTSLKFTMGATGEGVDTPRNVDPPITPIPSKNKQRGYMLLSDRLTVVANLGKGAFGSVVKAHDSSLNQEVAVKMLSADDPAFDLDDLNTELMSLRKCDSPFVTRLHDARIEKCTVFLIMELMEGGSAYDLISMSPLNVAEITVIAKSMFCGLEYLHRSLIIHRDMKSDNLLLTRDGSVKIGDLGLAAILDDSLTRRTLAGTVFWMGPEMLAEKDYTYSIDIYSAGATLHELATGKPPFYGATYEQVMSRFEKGVPPPAMDHTFDKDLRDLFARCTQVSPLERPSAVDALRSPLFMDVPPSSILIPLIEKAIAEKNASPQVLFTPLLSSPEPRSYDTDIFEYSPLRCTDTNMNIISPMNEIDTDDRSLEIASPLCKMNLDAAVEKMHLPLPDEPISVACMQPKRDMSELGNNLSESTRKVAGNSPNNMNQCKFLPAQVRSDSTKTSGIPASTASRSDTDGSAKSSRNCFSSIWSWISGCIMRKTNGTDAYGNNNLAMTEDSEAERFLAQNRSRSNSDVRGDSVEEDHAKMSE